ncbi:Homoserine/homoserine lactone efflux protein [Pseudovibrio sp. Ad13]|uniref:LysE family translocator n=1 Tax=Pseudovibrio sp. Ad13 TaxID=989396 RepID=UPI0007AE626F|nr:LysE family translocator [Pseudovibrio sp. Ad13]KZK87179.1 Homoserine/homoserine lactone efflux protein [Pseudovibrio sp. Ad13]
MDVTSLALFGGTLFTLAIIPGPAVFAIIARAMSFGSSGAVLFCLGLLSGDLLWFSMAALGLAAIASSFSEAFVVLQWLGAAYLTYLAWGIWKSANAVPSEDDSNSIPPQSSAKTSLFAGLLFNLSNPKAIMFYLALMPNLVSVEEMSLLGFVELAAVLSAILLIINGAYSFLAVKFCQFLRSEKTMYLINRLASLGLLGIAVLMITR